MALGCSDGSIADLQQSFCWKTNHVEARCWRRVWCASAVGRPRLLQDELRQHTWLSQLKGYVKQGKSGEAEALMQKMQEAGIGLNLLCYNSMITVHGKSDRFASALNWFCRLEANTGLQPDGITYRSMIGACGRAGELEGALNFYHEMKTSGFCPSTQSFNTLISLHRKAEDHGQWKEQILSLLVEMKEMGCCPDSSTVDVLVKVYERWGILEHLADAVSLLKAAGWSPTFRCHTIFLKAYIRCGLVDQALKVFHTMCSQEHLGSHNLCNQVSKVVQPSTDGGAFYFKPGGENLTLSYKPVYQQGVNQSVSNEVSEKILSSKQDTIAADSNAHGCSSNVNMISLPFRIEEAVCHNLICLCRTSARHAEAIQVYSVMRQSGICPSWFTACTVIDICGRMSDISAVEIGESLFEEMRCSASGRESTDVGAYTVTINMFLKAGMIQKAAKISSLVTEHEELVPDGALFLAMLRAYSRNSMPAKAIQVYKRMLEVRLTWTASMFNGVIHCIGRALPLEESIKVFLAMVYAKIPLSNVMCNLMMDIFAKAGLLEKAENVFKLAEEQGALDAISFNTLIDAYGKYKEFYKMERTLLDMQSSGFKDHVEAYNSMLDAYGKGGQLSRMENILERMRRADCPPDLSTYNTLINVYGREGLIAEVKNVQRNMEKAKIKPDNYTFNTLIFAYGNAEMPNEAMGAFKEMQDLNLVPDEVTYNCLIAAFEKSGNHLEAARWSLWMTQLGMR